MEDAPIMVSKAEVLRASIIANEALKFMAQKAMTTPQTILTTMLMNPTGNMAKYFKFLTSEAMAKC